MITYQAKSWRELVHLLQDYNLEKTKGYVKRITVKGNVYWTWRAI